MHFCYDVLVHGLYKLHRPNKLHPPVAILALEPVPVKVVHILHCRQKTGWIGSNYNLNMARMIGKLLIFGTNLQRQEPA